MKLGREVSRHNELDNWRNTHRFESVMATKWLLLTISETEPGLWYRLYYYTYFRRRKEPILLHFNVIDARGQLYLKVSILRVAEHASYGLVAGRNGYAGATDGVGHPFQADGAFDDGLIHHNGDGGYVAVPFTIVGLEREAVCTGEAKSCTIGYRVPGYLPS